LCIFFRLGAFRRVFDKLRVAQKIIDILCSGLPGYFISEQGTRRLPSIPAGVMEVRVYVAAAGWLLFAQIAFLFSRLTVVA